MVQNMAEPEYADILLAATARLDEIAAEVARDIALDGEDIGVLAEQILPAIAWLVERLAVAPELTPDALAALRDEGARLAWTGESLALVLDRYLSTGWVVWGTAAQPGADAAALAALGRALLRAVDHAAAALGEGYSGAERDIAARTASARREYLDELLDLPPDDPAAAARIRRRAAQFGLDAAHDYRVLVADVGRELEDDGPELDRVAGALARPRRAERKLDAAPAPIVATRRGRLVVFAPATGVVPRELDALLERMADGGAWRAAVSRSVRGVAGVGGAYREAIETLDAAARTGRRGRVDAEELLLERALLADEELARQAVDVELAPLLAAPRNAELLVETLRTWLSAGQNIRRAARALDVAPRTVAYRLSRIEALLGVTLGSAPVGRLATALEIRRLLGRDPASTARDDVLMGNGEQATTGAAGRRPRAPRGTARSRPGP